MLKKRVLTAALGIPIITAIVWFGEPWFTLLIVIWGLMAVFEFYRLVENSTASPLTYFGLAWTLLFILSRNSNLQAAIEPHFDISLLTPILLISAVILSISWFLSRPHKEKVLNSWAWTMTGIFYVGWLFSYLVAMRGLENGRNWVFFALFVTFASDTMAFFIGKTWGKIPLAPQISPKKTWEGAIGGIIGAILISMFFLLPTPIGLNFNWWHAIILGLLVSIFGQIGDLAESLFKRNMGVKDSSKLIPGHGGVLDRMDSIVFAVVVVYFYAMWTT
ncbi:phosphatidate cytidylyltransferase [Chloroflexota bacterium]